MGALVCSHAAYLPNPIYVWPCYSYLKSENVKDIGLSRNIEASAGNMMFFNCMYSILLVTAQQSNTHTHTKKKKRVRGIIWYSFKLWIKCLIRINIRFRKQFLMAPRCTNHHQPESLLRSELARCYPLNPIVWMNCIGVLPEREILPPPIPSIYYYLLYYYHLGTFPLYTIGLRPLYGLFCATRYDSRALWRFWAHRGYGRVVHGCKHA